MEFKSIHQLKYLLDENKISVKEIAETVYFLCSEKARYITGVQLSVDGGLTKSF